MEKTETIGDYEIFYAKDFTKIFSKGSSITYIVNHGDGKPFVDKSSKTITLFNNTHSFDDVNYWYGNMSLCQKLLGDN